MYIFGAICHIFVFRVNIFVFYTCFPPLYLCVCVQCCACVSESFCVGYVFYRVCGHCVFVCVCVLCLYPVCVCVCLCAVFVSGVCVCLVEDG